MNVIIATGLGKPGGFRILCSHLCADHAIHLTKFRWGQVKSIARLMEHNTTIDVAAVHSYGGSSVCFAAERVPECTIKHLVCFDMVYRPTPDHIDKDSLDENLIINVPSNIEQVYLFRQTHSWIRGQRVHAPNSTVTEIIDESCDHWEYDKLQAGIDAVLRLCNGS